jgi:hypothetical protein
MEKIATPTESTIVKLLLSHENQLEREELDAKTRK